MLTAKKTRKINVYRNQYPFYSDSNYYYYQDLHCLRDTNNFVTENIVKYKKKIL